MVIMKYLCDLFRLNNRASERDCPLKHTDSISIYTLLCVTIVVPFQNTQMLFLGILCKNSDKFVSYTSTAR